MLLPSGREIAILSPMSLFRCCFAVLVCSLLAGSHGCATAQSHLQHSVNRYSPASAQRTVLQPVRPRSTPKPAATPAPVRQQPPQQIRQQPNQQSIQQATYTTENHALQEPKRLRFAAGQPSQADADLHQPWNLSEFPVRSLESNTPYRLVSDTQEKTPPPAGGLQNLLVPKVPQTQNSTSQRPTSQRSAQVSRTQVSTTPAAARTNRAMPILNIGRDILNEFRPSNDRKWSQNHAVLQTATINGNLVTVHNVRYSRYESADSYTTQYYDVTFNLDDIRTLDLVMVPFQGLSRVAHVESSFGFADGRQIGLSIEARYEEGEKYDPAAAGMRQFELIYVLADERDMIRLATDVHKNNVHIYRLNFEPNEVRAMFVDALQRANRLAAKPEFYHPLTNSCVTNLIAHINKGRPKAVPAEYRTLMPGLLDNYMYDLKLVATSAKTFKEAKEMAKVNWLVERYGDLEYFSAGIRQNMY